MSSPDQDYQNLKTIYQGKLSLAIYNLSIDLIKLQYFPLPDQYHKILSQVHKFKGSSGVYSFFEVKQLLESLEIFLISFDIDKSLSEESKNQLNYFSKLLACQSIAKSTDDTLSIPHAINKKIDDTIFLFDDDFYTDIFFTEFREKKFQLHIFKHVDTFLEALEKQIPFAIFINIDLASAKVLEFFKKNIVGTQSLINYLSKTDSYALRLQSIRMCGNDFYVKPLKPTVALHKLEQHIEILNKEYQVLIIDDDVAVCKFYSLILNQAGMLTRMVNKIAALETVLFDFLPDLVLVDLQMPECDGSEVVQLLRQNELYEAIPIVYISGAEESDKHLDKIISSADGFISKFTSADNVVSAIRTRAHRYEILRSLMIRDSLTNVFNRLYIMQALRQECYRANRDARDFSIVLIDIDHFKKVNDQYGHSAGDQVLKNLCLFLLENLRKSDLVGRIGGEEFLIILPACDAHRAKILFDKIRVDFYALSHFVESYQISLTFSAGIANYSDHKDFESMVKAADLALYASKNKGRNCLTISSK